MKKQWAAGIAALLFGVLIAEAVFAATSSPGQSGLEGAAFRRDSQFAKGEGLAGDFDFDAFLTREVIGEEGCMRFGEESEFLRTLLFINNSATDDIEGFFFAESGLTPSDYEFRRLSTNDFVLVEDDVTVEVGSEPIDGGFNITLDFDFNKCAGITIFTLEAVRRSDDSVYCQAIFTYTVAGFCIYEESPEGVRTVYTGRTEDVWSESFVSLLDNPDFTFNSFFQYIDGANSSVPVPSVPSIGDIDPTFVGRTQLIRYNSEQCSIDGGNYDGSVVVTDPGCGQQFSTNQPGPQWPGTFWGVRFTQYVAGQLMVHFGWPSFTDGFEEQFAEEYETFMIVSILGNPPPVVFRIEPDIPFKSEGGEDVTVYMLNTFNAQARILNVNTVGVYSPQLNTLDNSPDVQVLNYTVAPGSGNDLPWTMTVTTAGGETIQAVDLTAPPYLFDYFGLIPLDPTVGPETGEIPITACAFDIENWDRSRDEVLFGGVSVPNRYLPDDTVSQYCIVFELPPRFEIGDPYVYNVSVVVDGELTFLDFFTYIPDLITAEIIPSGPSQSTSNDTIWNLAACVPSTYVARITPAFVSTVVILKWTVVDLQTGLIVPLSSDSDFSIGFDGFQLEAGDYQITLEATYIAGEIVREASDTIIIRKGEVPGLAVDVLPVVARGVTDPNQSLRVYCTVRFPDESACPITINSSALTYVWSYAGQVMPEFSYVSTSLVEGGETPTKLGQEFVIDIPNLEIGIEQVSVLVTLDENPNINGTDRERVEIVRVAPVAVINGGMSRLLWWNSAELVIDGSASWNPNSAGGPTGGLTYSFTCLKGDSEGSFDQQCGGNIDQSGSDAVLTIAPNRFTGILGGSDVVFMEFTLTVSDGELSGSKVLIVELRSEERSQPLNPTLSVGSGNAGDSKFYEGGGLLVPFYRDVILTPGTSTEGVSVEYRAISPEFDNDIARFAGDVDGFWFPGNPENIEGALSLFIPKNTLEPDTTYVFEAIMWQNSTTQEATIVQIRFRTVPRPQVIMLPLPVTSGTVDQLFSALSISTLSLGDNFQFFYYLVSADGPEICVMGCNGQNSITWQIPFFGTYTLRVELWDALGFQLLSSDISSSTITITEGERADEGLTPVRFDELFQSGNSAQYELNAWFFNTFFVSSSTRQSVALDVDSLVTGLARIVDLSIPSARQSENYAQSVASVMKLSTAFIPFQATVYNLWDIMIDLVYQTPVSEKLSIGLQAERVLNFTRKHVVSSDATGTTRSRLIRQEVVVNTALLDYFELTPLFLVASARDEACGVVTSASTLVADGDAEGGSNEFGGEFFTINSVLGCSASQVGVVRGPSSTLTVCPEALAESPKVFSVIESDDYIFLSRVQGSNATQSVRLLSLDIWQFSSTGILEAATSAEFESCYTLNIDLQPDAVEPRPAALGPPKVYGIGETVDEFGAYNEISGAISNIAGTPSRVSFSADVPAVYQVRSFAPDPTPVPGTGSPTPEPTNVTPPGGGGLSGGAIAGIVVGILIFIIIAVMVSWLIASRCLLVTATPPPPLELDETFVERDVYGRSMWANEMGMNPGMA